ncbi:MAG: DeoR/GlpR family DNA-binding transcription regulator [Clostridia bacterium]|nr:DeoR/GlpR family DNA-binding transcription regulator [Clostridia bacterium]
MLAFERQQRIIELLHESGAVSVSRLSSEFGVAEETIRRDLEKLEKQEKLLRTHGGAIPVDDSKHEPSIEKRRKLNVEEKKCIARVAAELISPGDTIFLDASTTTFFLARELKGMQNITVITNSLQTMEELSGVDGIKLIGTGGIVGSNLSFVGSLAENAVREKYFANKMFFSSRGITLQAGILDSNEQECAMKKCMMENSQQKIYVCEHSKIDRIGFAKLASFEEIDTFVTDLPLDEEWHRIFDEANTQLIEAK